MAFFQKHDTDAPEMPKGQEVPKTGDAADSQAAESSAQDAAFSAVNSECSRLEHENADLKDQLLRRQAEFDNYRKRTERERGESRLVATMDAVRAMLPVLDGLEAALKSSQHSGDEVYKGVELVEKQLREILERLGVQRIAAQGQPFDPQLHHAVDTVESDEHPDHTVIDVFQQGYLFKDRLLRPAMVRVTSRPVVTSGSD